MKHSVYLAAVALLLASCSSNNSSTSVENSPSTKTEQPQREPTVFDPQLKALDKAKQVEADLKKQKEERDKQIEAAEK